MSPKVRIWDLVLILALVACSCIPWLIPASQGQTVTVSVDGREVVTLPLSEDREYPLPDGTVVVVRDGAAWVEKATCADKLCEEMGKISSEGQTVLCLPNRISLVISGEVDAYVG